MPDDEVQRQILDTFIPRDRDFIENADTLLNIHIRSADVFVEWERRDLAEKLASELEEVLLMREKMRLHVQAMEALLEDYRFEPGTCTDFKAFIKDRVSQLMSRRFEAKETEEYASFRQCLRGRERGEQGKAGPSGEVNDDEIEVVDDSECAVHNTLCPISGKLIEDLTFPVVDQAGYVYEQEAIIKHIDQQGGGVQCPVAGTTDESHGFERVFEARLRFVKRA